MRRGEVYLVDLEPIQGSEAGKTRPAVLVSNDAANRVASRTSNGVVTVVPVTSNVKRVYPFQVLLPADRCGLRVDSKAQAEQVRSVSAGRLVRRVGALPTALVAELDDALRRHLSL